MIKNTSKYQQSSYTDHAAIMCVKRCAQTTTECISHSVIHTNRNGRQIDRFNEMWQESSLKTNNIPLQYLVTAAHCSQSIAKLQTNPRLKLVLLRWYRPFAWQQHCTLEHC